MPSKYKSMEKNLSKAKFYENLTRWLNELRFCVSSKAKFGVPTKHL